MKIKKIFASVLLMMFVIGAPTVYAEDVIKDGDYVKFGSYNGDAIVWRCIGNDENGDAILITDKIISLKAFDSKGDEDTEFTVNYGNGRWKDSTLRTWLNSGDDVDWGENKLPSSANVKDGANPYSDEKGFLSSNNFSAEDLALLVPHTYKTIISYKNVDETTSGTEDHLYSYIAENVLRNYDNAYSEILTDRVFLPSVKDVNKLSDIYAYGVSGVFSKPTFWVAETNKNSFSGLKEGSNWYYWLRDAMYSADDSKVRCVGYDGAVGYASAYDGNVGVRPMIVLDSENLGIISGDGSFEMPYSVTGGETCTIQVENKKIFKGDQVDINLLSNFSSDVKISLYHNQKLISSDAKSKETITAESGINIITARVYDTQGNLLYVASPVMFYNIIYEPVCSAFEGLEAGEALTFENGVDDLNKTSHYSKNPPKSYVEIVDEGGEHGKIARICSVDGAGANIYTPNLKNIQNDCLDVEFDVRFDNIGLLDKSLFSVRFSGVSESANPVNIDKEGSLILGGIEGGGETGFTFREGKWYRLKAVFDNKTKTFTLIIDGKIICHRKKINRDYTFIPFVEITSTWNSTSTLHSVSIDNLSVNVVNEVSEDFGVSIYNPESEKEQIEVTFANATDKKLTYTYIASITENNADGTEGALLDVATGNDYLNANEAKTIIPQLENVESGNVFKLFTFKDLKSLLPLSKMQSTIVK